MSKQSLRNVDMLEGTELLRSPDSDSGSGATALTVQPFEGTSRAQNWLFPCSKKLASLRIAQSKVTQLGKRASPSVGEEMITLILPSVAVRNFKGKSWVRFPDLVEVIAVTEIEAKYR